MPKNLKKTHLIGIDEVGRGPIAGPIAVCAIAFNGVIPKFLKGIKDSKHVSKKKREEWYKKFLKARRDKILDFSVSCVNSKVVDKKGINFATKLAIRNALIRLNKNPDHCRVLLDGLLYAPKTYKNQKTIIRGDQTEPAISAASVIAKVYRDRKMKRFSKKYPQYDFDKNSGYGTKRHLGAIKKHGVCKIHRKSFLTKT